MTTLMQMTIESIISAAMQTAEYKYPDQTPAFSLKIENPPYMSLVIERLYAADHGRQVVSVCHYGEQNGDAMRDPEMCFDFEDWRPLYFRNDYMGVEQYVFVTPERKQYRPRLAADLRSFATTWARNLREQGFKPAAAAQLRAQLGLKA